MSRSEAIYHRVVIWVLLIVLMLPLLATLVYALVLEWGATILPSGFTLKWLVALWSDPRFLIALWHSLLVWLWFDRSRFNRLCQTSRWLARRGGSASGARGGTG